MAGGRKGGKARVRIIGGLVEGGAPGRRVAGAGANGGVPASATAVGEKPKGSSSPGIDSDLFSKGFCLGLGVEFIPELGQGRARDRADDPVHGKGDNAAAVFVV